MDQENMQPKKQATGQVSSSIITVSLLLTHAYSLGLAEHCLLGRKLHCSAEHSEG